MQKFLFFQLFILIICPIKHSSRNFYTNASRVYVEFLKEITNETQRMQYPVWSYLGPHFIPFVFLLSEIFLLLLYMYVNSCLNAIFCSDSLNLYLLYFSQHSSHSIFAFVLPAMKEILK